MVKVPLQPDQDGRDRGCWISSASWRRAITDVQGSRPQSVYSALDCPWSGEQPFAAGCPKPWNAIPRASVLGSYNHALEGPMPDIKQAKILIMATDGFEQSELLVPQEKLSDAGATVEVAAPKSRQKSGRSTAGTRPTGARPSRWTRTSKT